MVKKLFMIILAVVSVGLLAACGESANADAAAVAEEPTVQTGLDQDGVYEPQYADKKAMLEAAENAEPLTEDAGKVGSKVLDFKLHTFDGGTIGSEDMKGRVTMLVFFFPTCPTCRLELPKLKQVTGALGRDLQVIAVEINNDKEGAEEFIYNNSLPFTFASADRVFVKKYFNTEGYPNTFLIDREGVIRQHELGYQAGQELDYLNKLQELLEE